MMNNEKRGMKEEERLKELEQELLRLKAKLKETLEGELFAITPETHCPRCLKERKEYVKGELLKKIIFKRTVGEIYKCPKCGSEWGRTLFRK